MKKLALLLAAIAIAVAAYLFESQQEAPGTASDMPDPNSHFTHFRVGQRNVKAILVDGDVTWVGTSGGIIRYDTQADSYTLFDTATGLLANGIFHLSKLDGRLAAGTYGGGLSILNDDGET